MALVERLWAEVEAKPAVPERSIASALHRKSWPSGGMVRGETHNFLEGMEAPG